MITGRVDDAARALVTVFIASGKSASRKPLEAWIDTAFNGGLVLPRTEIVRLKLQKSSVSEAILADGKLTAVELFTCHLDWFGKTYRTQVVANDGEFALLGTQLLANRRLVIDYAQRTVTLQ